MEYTKKEANYEKHLKNQEEQQLNLMETMSQTIATNDWTQLRVTPAVWWS